jgi:hypothetical protein
MNTFRSNDRNTKSSRQKKKGKQLKKHDKRNLSIPFVISVKRGTSKSKKNFGMSYKTDEKRSKKQFISQIPGTMECNNRDMIDDKSLSLSDPSQNEFFDYNKRILKTPQKCKLSNKKTNKREMTSSKMKINKENKKIVNKFSNQKENFLDNAINEMKEKRNEKLSELSQKFVSDVIIQESNTDQVHNLPKKKQKGSFIDQLSSFEKGEKINLESKFDNKPLGRKNETISYNLSQSIQSKQFEFSGKILLLKSKSRNAIKQFHPKNKISAKQMLFNFVNKFDKKMEVLDFLDVLDDFEIFSKWRLIKNKWKFLKKCLKNQSSSSNKNIKITLKLIRYYASLLHHKSRVKNTVIESPIKKNEILVTRECFSKNIGNQKIKCMNSSKKKNDTVTTKEILTCQSTKVNNKDIKESYMFNNSYKTGQKLQRKKHLQTRTSHYNKDIVYSSVLNYSDMSRTNLSNHLKKDSELYGKKGIINDTLSRINQTKRKKKSVKNKENRYLRSKKNKRPPMRCVASAMKLTRDQIFSNNKISKKEKKKSIKNKLYQGMESKLRMMSSHEKHLYQDPVKESETDRVLKKKLNLGGLEMDSHKSLISNFWNEKLTKRQSIQQSKLKKHLNKNEKKDQDAKSTKVKWDRKTVKSLRDKGLEMKGVGTTTGESLLSSKQETSLMKGSMRRVSVTGINSIKNKSPNHVFKKKKKSSLKLRKLKQKKKKTEGPIVKVNKSIKMKFKGNFRKMKSISPPSNWSLSRFNKMKNTFFKKKKKEENSLKKSQKDNYLKSETKTQKTNTLSGGKKVNLEKESPKDIGSSSNFYCNNPYQGLTDKPRISRVLAVPKDQTQSNKNEKGPDTKQFFKKTLPEISEGETNESSEHTIIMSAKKDSEEKKKQVKNNKLNNFTGNKRVKKGNSTLITGLIF